MNNPQRDRAWGRFYARNGGARVFLEGLHAPSPWQRLTRFRILYSAVPIEATLPRRSPC